MSERFNEIQGMLDEPLSFDTQSLPTCQRKLPDAYTDWASSSEASTILHKFSNTDKFWFTPNDDDVVSTTAGEILLFSRESQGNFELGVLLNTAEPDPPVLFSDFRRQRWIHYCDRFTDAIFAQIFDWQHRLVFDDDCGAEIDYYETVDVKICDDMLAALREAYTEHPKTNWFMETPGDATTWRFSTPDGERILLTHNPIPPYAPNRSSCWLEVLAPIHNRVDRVKSLCQHLKNQSL